MEARLHHEPGAHRGGVRPRPGTSVKPSPDLTWPAATAAVNETVRWDRDERLSTRRCCETVGAGPTRSIRQLKARVLGHQAIRITGRSAHAPPRRTEPARQRATRAAGSDAIPPFPAIHGNHTRTTKHAKLVMVVISRRRPRAPLDMWAHSGAFLASRNPVKFRKSGTTGKQSIVLLRSSWTKPAKMLFDPT